MSEVDEDDYDESDDSMEGDECSEEEELNIHHGKARKSRTPTAAPGRRQSQYVEEIRDVIAKHNENPSELSTFSTGGEVDAVMGVPAVHVDGVGRLAYPLCKEQTVTLLSVSTQAPFGKGKETVVDVDVRRAWQIDSNLVHINPLWLANSLPKLVTDCCVTLGIDAVKTNVRANLYKMLLYEEGGHFKKHRDTEKEPGMFGSLLVQLPADHEGGHLVVEHDKQKKRYQFDKESADKAYYAAFYADCEHTLEPVTKGLRLVLAFNLVRGGASSVPKKSLSTIADRRGFDDVLQGAAKAWCTDPSAVQKLALPLTHKYTHTNVSFAGLKGTDLSTLNLLQDACDPVTHEKLFRVYLALVTKHETGTEEDDGDAYENRYRHRYGDRYGNRYGNRYENRHGNRYGNRYGSPESDGGGMIDKEVTYETKSWMGPTGALDFGDLSVDFDEELLIAQDTKPDKVITQMFGTEPDDEEREGYCGNYAGPVEYWYHSAVLVFWPAQKDFDIKLAANPAQAVALLQGLDRTSPDFVDKFARLLTFLGTDCDQDWHPAEIFPLVQTVEQVRSVLTLCHELVLTEEDATAIVLAMMKHSWTSLHKDFKQLLESQPPPEVIMLLGLIHQHCHPLCPASPSADAPHLVPQEAWEALLFVLTNKFRQSNSPTASSTYSFRHTPRMADLDSTKVSRFVIQHCTVQDQVTVAAHLGTKVRVQSLHQLLQQLQLTVGEADANGPFLTELRACVVQQCIDKSQPADDMVAVVDWVVRGQHADLLVRLHAKLKRLCNDSTFFRAVFELPSVVAELKKETPLSAELESHVQARIVAVARESTVPPFSWRMSANQITHDDPRIGEFLTSDLESTSIVGGWNGIANARKWVTKSCGRGQPVTAEAFGTGKKTGVTLTKNKTAHDIVVRRCAENALELQALRQLIQVRGGGGGVVENEVDGGSSVEAPPAKKARV